MYQQQYSKVDLSVGLRLVFALLISVAFHVALIATLKVNPDARGTSSASVIEARIALDAPFTEITVEDSAPNTEFKEEPFPLTPEVANPLLDSELHTKEVVETSSEELVATPEATAEPGLPLMIDPTYYPTNQLDVYPSALDRVDPMYPDKAKAENIHGSILLLLLIDESGSVRDISVVKAEPEGFFEDSALAAFRNVRFSPGQRNGRVVRSRLLIRAQYDVDWNTETVR